jgi:hypothetical protein
MQNFKTPRQPLLGELAMSWREERKRREEEKKMPFIVATYVYASSQGQRTHSARTNRPPIDTSGNFQVHVSVESPLNTCPNPSEFIS